MNQSLFLEKKKSIVFAKLSLSLIPSRAMQRWIPPSNDCSVKFTYGNMQIDVKSLNFASSIKIRINYKILPAT